MEGALLANVLKILEGVVGALWRFITRRPVVPKHTLRIVPKESDCWWRFGDHSPPRCAQAHAPHSS